MEEEVKSMKAVLQIAPLECAGCKKKIENHLSQVDGIKSVNVFPRVAKVRIEFDSSKTSETRIKDVMEALDYPVLSIKTNQETAGKKE